MSAQPQLVLALGEICAYPEFLFARIEPEYSPRWFSGWQFVPLDSRLTQEMLYCRRVIDAIHGGNMAVPWLAGRLMPFGYVLIRRELLVEGPVYYEMCDQARRSNGTGFVAHGVVLPLTVTSEEVRSFARSFGGWIRTTEQLRAALLALPKEM